MIGATCFGSFMIVSPLELFLRLRPRADFTDSDRNHIININSQSKGGQYITLQILGSPKPRRHKSQIFDVNNGNFWCAETEADLLAVLTFLMIGKACFGSFTIVSSYLACFTLNFVYASDQERI